MSESEFLYTIGEVVKIKSGSFTNFTGRVKEVNGEKATLKVVCVIFGRVTPVELNFSEVEKVNFIGK